MANISDEERLSIEGAIDDFLSNIELFEKNISADIVALGIEPNIDTILSFYFGFMFGFFSTIHNSDLRAFSRQIIPLLERRAWEMRQALIRDIFK